MKVNPSPLVTIIMNCYNGEKYLHESISSVINQKYKNWELIFWDNRSHDNSRKIVKSFNDIRIKYFLAKKFTNLHKARNLALKKAKGKYISFLDTDDLLLENKLLLQVKKLEEIKLSFIYSNCYLRNDNTFLKKKKYMYKKLLEGHISEKLLIDFQVALPTILIKKNIINNFLFNERYKIVGDRDLIMRISLKEKFCCINTPLATYRIHSNNFSGKNKLLEIKELQHWIKEFKKINKKRYNLDEAIFKKFENKLKIKKKIYLLKGINQKIFLIKKLISDPNLFNFSNCLKNFLPNSIKSKFFFFH